MWETGINKVDCYNINSGTAGDLKNILQLKAIVTEASIIKDDWTALQDRI